MVAQPIVATVEELAHRFGFKKAGKTWRGPCVAHGGKGRNLAIWDGDGGSIGAKCHSEGCSYQSILDSLGVQFTYSGRTYHYGNGNGGLDNGRSPVTRRRGPNKDMTRNYGSPRGLLVKLGENNSHGKEVVLVEGEKAFDAVVARDSEDYTAAHWIGGTSSVAHADYSPLKGRHVILWPDADEAGIHAMSIAAAKLDGIAASLRIVDTSPLDTGADAADVGDADMKRLLETALDYSPPPPVSEESERIADGAQFDRLAKGLKAALSTLKLDIRQNTRGGSIELQRSDSEEPAAITFGNDAGLTPDGMGWAVLSANTASYIRDLFADRYKDTNGRAYKLSVETWQENVRALIAGRQVDPVQDWLSELPTWDGVERIPTMFVDALGAEDSDLNHEIARAFFVAAIKRTFEPACQHDWIPVLIGDQGGGKTTLCRELAPSEFTDWFSRAPDMDTDTQRQSETIGNAWLVEFPELSVGNWRKAKSYIDETHDRYRRPYAHAAEIFPRRWVGIATANDEGEGVLPDDFTGNRRYYAIKVNTPGETREAQSQHVREYLDKNRLQLWAEGLHRYNNGEKSYLGGEFENMQDAMNAKYTRTNQPMEIIAEQLSTAHADGAPVTLAALLIEAGFAENAADAQSKARSSGRELSGHLTRKKWSSNRRTINGVRAVWWYPPHMEGDLCVVCNERPKQEQEGTEICYSLECLDKVFIGKGKALAKKSGPFLPFRDDDCPVCGVKQFPLDDSPDAWGARQVAVADAYQTLLALRTGADVDRKALECLLPYISHQDAAHWAYRDAQSHAADSGLAAQEAAEGRPQLQLMLDSKTIEEARAKIKQLREGGTA